MTSFLFDPLARETPLRSQFQRLFQVSTQSACKVGEIGSWVEDQWVWDFRWRRDLFVWEFNLLDNLFDILNGSPISIAIDSWCWKHDLCGVFSIKSDYMVHQQSTADEVFFSEDEIRLLPKKRRVITNAGACTRVLCCLGSESTDHLFGSCNQILPIWYAILRWLGVEWVSPRGILGCFEVFLDMGMSRKKDSGGC
ncbi:hypothetical protein TSUD_23270 [Trifolium subterraneum]|uniref:Reverse transcriptase zinc-binding domain-containing protein n=1 Tax=Trifolium subterraneum TaxID=3900 RepID=A0A2Z6ML10_TRISU|nr:hypothetical protein TSUD_23270 [Trifolium subterraneum]